MTGFPDPQGGDQDDFGAEEPLLRQPPGYLAPPPGEFARLRGRAARRRRVRAAGGGLAAAGVLTGSLYLVGVLAPRGDGTAERPPATGLTASPTPRTVPPAPPATTAPPATPSAPHGSTPPPGSAAPSSPGSGPTASPRHSTGGAQGGKTPMCAAADLTAALGGQDAGAGSVFRYVVLTNTGSAACHLTGYPGLSLLDADGRQIGRPADRDPRDYQPVVLEPGGSASDTLRTANRMGTCQPASAALRIYPPGSTESLDFPGEVTVCGDLFTITPLTAGRTGNPPA